MAALRIHTSLFLLQGGRLGGQGTSPMGPARAQLQMITVNSSARGVEGVRPSARRQLARLPLAGTRSAPARGAVISRALPPEFKASIDEFVTSNKIVVFMKGNKEMPQCGFSNTVVQILNQLSVPFVTVDILENEMLRAGMKEYSCWPTFPQVYVDGEFYGGCDIMIEGYQNGELAEALEIALNS